MPQGPPGGGDPEMTYKIPSPRGAQAGEINKQLSTGEYIPDWEYELDEYDPDESTWDPGAGAPQVYPPREEDVPWYIKLGQTIMPGGEPGFLDLYSGTGKEGEDPSIFRQAANVAVPLGIGKWAHDYQKDWLAKQPKFPGDETKIDFKTAREYMDDPKQRFKPKEIYADTAAMAAEGGRIGYADGLTVAEKGPLYIDPDTDLPLHNIEKEIQGMDREQRLKMYFEMLRKIESYKEIEELDQGRKFEDLLHWGAMGGDEISGGGSGASEMTEALEFTEHPAAEALYEKGEHFNRGGRARAQEGGLMNLGGMEKDYRQEGGFVPIGGQEKADDVPARLSKNEFVFTADAVRAAGGGDIDAGAEVMENLMENLEAGGKVSEESQGLEGARGMFANAQQLEKRII